jgi:hypothetical protein
MLNKQKDTKAEIIKKSNFEIDPNRLKHPYVKYINYRKERRLFDSLTYDYQK